MGHYTEEILRNTREIKKLHSRIHETLKDRDKNEHKYKEWQRACAEFHDRYDNLAFPGGYAGAFDRIMNGDHKAMEAGICFLECRPYFFRSGYMFKDLIRKLKKAPLTDNQQARLETVQKAYENYKANKKA